MDGLKEVELWRKKQHDWVGNSKKAQISMWKMSNFDVLNHIKISKQSCKFHKINGNDGRATRASTQFSARLSVFQKSQRRMTGNAGYFFRWQWRRRQNAGHSHSLYCGKLVASIKFVAGQTQLDNLQCWMRLFCPCLLRSFSAFSCRGQFCPGPLFSGLLPFLPFRNRRSSSLDFVIVPSVRMGFSWEERYVCRVLYIVVRFHSNRREGKVKIRCKILGPKRE